MSRPAWRGSTCIPRGNHCRFLFSASERPPAGGRYTVATSIERECVVVGALNLAAGHGASARHMHLVSDNGTSRTVQAVAWDRHWRELLPRVRFRIVRFVCAEYLSCGFTPEYNNLAIDKNAGRAAARRRKRRAECPSVGPGIVHGVESRVEIVRIHAAGDGVNFTVDNGNAHMIALADERLRAC